VEKKGPLAYVAKHPAKLRDWIDQNLKWNIPNTDNPENITRFCFAFDYENRGAKGVGIYDFTIRGAGVNGGGATGIRCAFTWYEGYKNLQPPANTAEFHAVHEIVHSFLQGADRKMLSQGEVDSVKEHYKFDADGHDPAGTSAWNGTDAAMLAQGGGVSFCLKHLEALRRQRYGFFIRWYQEKDKK